MARELTAYGFAATLITIAPGGTAAVLVKPLGYEVSSTIKYFGGGSLEIFNAALGSTSAATVTLGTGYLMSGGEAINADGSAIYLLAATGATAQAYSLRGLSQGFTLL